jgi:hypothetical protein
MVAYPHQIVPPNPNLQLVSPQTGILTTNGLQFLQQLWALVVDTNQVTPCTCTNYGNQYNLTPFPTSAKVQQGQPGTNSPNQYWDYSIYTFVASATSTGPVTASVAPLGVRNVYKLNGSTQASSGDVVSGDLYFLIANSALNSGNGGFVLK